MDIPTESIGTLILTAVNSVTGLYQCILARSIRPQRNVTPDEARNAIIGADWEIRGFNLAFEALSNLAGRNELLDKGLHPSIYRRFPQRGKGGRMGTLLSLSP